MRNISHLLSLLKMYFASTRDLRLLYYERVVRDLVNKLAFFFFPIYLFELGKRLLPQFISVTDWQAGLLALAGFFFIYRILVAIIVIPVGKLVSIIGYQRALVYSYVIRILSFLGMFVSVYYPIVIVFSIIMEAIQVSLYWPSFHTLLTKYSVKKHFGSSLGVLQVLLLILGAITPALSGMLNSAFGFQLVFLLGIIGAVISLCLMMMLSDSCDFDKVSFTELKEWLQEERYEKLLLAMNGRLIVEIIHYLWPLYLFILFGTIERVGFLSTLSLFLALIVTVIATVKIDSAKSRVPYIISGSTISLAWLLRTQVLSFWSIALVDAIDRISSNYHWLFYDMTWYKRAKGSQAHSFFVYHELLQNVAMSVIWLMVVLILLLFSNWQLLFVIASAGVLFTLIIKEKKQ